MENKGKTWSRAKNSRPPFGVNLNLNLSICCCGATAGSEQQHNQEIGRKYIYGQRILEFITFYHNALHLTTLFTTMHCI